MFVLVAGCAPDLIPSYAHFHSLTISQPAPWGQTETVHGSSQICQEGLNNRYSNKVEQEEEYTQWINLMMGPPHSQGINHNLGFPTMLCSDPVHISHHKLWNPYKKAALLIDSTAKEKCHSLKNTPQHHQINAKQVPSHCSAWRLRRAGQWPCQWQQGQHPAVPLHGSQAT